MINLLRNLKIVIVLYFFLNRITFSCHQYFQSLPEVNLKSWIFQLFCFSIFFFDICRVYRDSFQSAKYMICFQIDKSETLVLLIFSPEFCLRDFSVTIQWFSMKFSGIMRIYENLIHLGGNVKMPFRCQVMDNFLILKWFFVSERSKERLIIWTGNLLEMIVHDL